MPHWIETLGGALQAALSWAFRIGLIIIGHHISFTLPCLRIVASAATSGLRATAFKLCEIAPLWIRETETDAETVFALILTVYINLMTILGLIRLIKCTFQWAET